MPITLFRKAVSKGQKLGILVRKENIPRLLPAVELCRERNGSFSMKCFNGLVVLEMKGITSMAECEALKHRAMDVPSTMAAFIGASGQSVKLLVCVCRADGSLPQEENEAEHFYQVAYRRMLPIYDAGLGQRLTRIDPHVRHAMLMPLDPRPLVNLQAVPFVIREDATLETSIPEDEHLLTLPEKVHDSTDIDIEAYEIYEQAYVQACEEALQQVEEGLATPVWANPDTAKAYLTALALQMQRRRVPQEETIIHIWNHWRFRNGVGATQNFIRSIVEAVYAEQLPARKLLPAAGSNSYLMREIIRRMESRYVFRHNTILDIVEYRPNHTWYCPWRPVTEKVINTMTTDLQLADLPVWDKDVRRYIHSTRISDFDPIEDFLFMQCQKWDGNDHIGQLAQTVPTDIPQQWGKWFHTWFLGMVAQWQGRNQHYGNSIVPLLISEQGEHKSSFCRLLLPPELRSWGYTDSLSLSDERAVHLAMAQMLLINLDEFNRIPARVQEGFLKNIIQLPNVKVKRPYGRRLEEVSRMASFIATTNRADVLTDPSGSRRFIGIHVTGSIDVSHKPNYPQLYAQAVKELQQGHRYWFDEQETRTIMEYNQRFRQQTDAESFFFEYFDLAQTGERTAEWFTTASILMHIKQNARSSFRLPPANHFGRVLMSIPGIVHKTSNHGELYLLKRRKAKEL